MAISGARYTLRRETVAAGPNEWTKGAATVAYHGFTGRARGYKPDEIRGGILEHDEKVIIEPASVSVVPRAGDRIALGAYTADAGAEWRHVISVYAARVNGQVGVYRLQVRR
jgi:hypothetical protein